MALFLLLVPSVIWTWSLVRSGEQVNDIAGAYTDEKGRIVLTNNKVHLRNNDELILVFDHELTHLFGQSKYRRIRRDAWLSYAYPAVLALERGGFGALQRAHEINRDFKQRLMYWFTEGAVDAALAVPSTDAETEFANGISIFRSTQMPRVIAQTYRVRQRIVRSTTG